MDMSLPEIEELKKHTFQLGPIRPPSEGGSGSLLLRVTSNCPWNLCTFCASYKGQKFVYRQVEEIKKDIDAAKTISDLLESLSNRLGGLNWVSRIIDPQFLYNKDLNELKSEENQNFENIYLIFNWLVSGARTVFLQDANSVIMRTNELVAVLKYIKKIFPQVERITSYARSKTLAQKSLEDLIRIRNSGLSRLHIGLETGDDEVLKFIKKGVTSKEQIEAGKKVKTAGFELSEYWMPGVGGLLLSENHARNTTRVLNEINPDYIRSRPFVPRRRTPLYETYIKGELKLTSPHDRLREIKIMIEGLKVNSKICFDHFLNSWRNESGEYLFKQDYEGYQFPEEKSKVLELIEMGLQIDEENHIHANALTNRPQI